MSEFASGRFMCIVDVVETPRKSSIVFTRIAPQLIHKATTYLDKLSALETVGVRKGSTELEGLLDIEALL